MDARRFLDVPGRSHSGSDRDDLVVWCRGPVEQHSSAVLLVHDRLANARCWDLVMGRLPAHVAVVAVDLRGRGSAWRQSPSLGVGTHVADLTELLDRLDFDEVLAVGHGFGATVVSALALASSDRIALTVGVLGQSASDPFDSVLGLAFPDREEHLRFWKLHPRLALADGRAVDAFVAHGVAGPEDHHRWRVDLRSLVADDQNAAETSGSAFSRSIAFGPLSTTSASIGVTQLPQLDPAVALLTNSGADAVVAQILPYLQ